MASTTVPGVAKEEKWSGPDNWLFWSFALGMLLESYVFALPPIATGWAKHLPPSLSNLLLAWAPIWLIIGIIISGPIADRFGRKHTFYLTMSVYAIGGIGLILSGSYVPILIFLALLLMASGGEMNTIMVASHEMMPRKHRSKTMMMEINFINLGGLVLASLAIATAAWSSSEALQKVSLGVAILIVLAILLLARLRSPESLRWLIKKGRVDQAREEAIKYYGLEQGTLRFEYAMQPEQQVVQPVASPSGRRAGLGVRFYVTLTTAFAGTAGFGLMTYTLGPQKFPTLTAQIIFVAGLVGFVSGFFGLWGDKLSRMWLLLVGYGGAFVFTVIIWLTIGAWSKSLALFWTLLVLLNVFVNVSYLTEDSLKGEIWPTERRGTYTAIVRFVSIGLYIPTIYLTAHLKLGPTMLFNMLVWAIGLSGAVLWMYRGVETGKGVSIDSISE